ncbi:unnamed protein product [Symbiodinium sp. KB8]|nr:unnamed protein product [Symbiodinium sp. KB8]
MAPVRQKADAASDFKFRAGAPPRMPRPEPQPQPLPVVPAPEETERKTGYRHWVAKTARPRLALRRLQVTQVGDKSEEKASKQRPRAGSTAAEAAFIQDVLGVDRTIVRGDDIRAELRGMPGGMPGGGPGAPGTPAGPGMPMMGMPMGMNNMTMNGVAGMGMPMGMPMMGGMGGCSSMGMNGMGMPMMAMNPMAMMNMAAMMKMMGPQEEETVAVEPRAPPPDPIDPRVKDICRNFGIDDKICEKLNKAMKTREDFDEDMQVLWHIMEKGAQNNKKAVDVMLVKIREINNGTFIGKDLLDPEIKDFAWKYNLDDQLLHRLIKTMKKRKHHKSQDLKDMDERIGNAKHPSGLLVRMLEGLEENGKMPPAPGWLMQSSGPGRREPEKPENRRRRVEELGELAKHRWDCRLHATRTSRRKAVQWRAQQIQRETLFRTRCRASIIVHQNPESYHDASGMLIMDKQLSNKVKSGASSQPLIMKGISCDTGILNVTFCPLMEETHSEEQEEEVTAIEPSPTPLFDEETEARPSLLRSGSSRRTLEQAEPLDRLMDISFADDETGQVEKKKSVPKLLVTSAAGELFNQNRKKRRELNRRLREVRRKYKEKMKEESSEVDNPVRSSYSIAGVPIEGMPNSSKAYLSQVSAFDEKTYRDVLRRFTDTDAIDQSDLREFLESVGFRPRNKPEREVMQNLLRNLDSLDIGFDVLFGEIIPAIRLGFAEIRSQDLVKRFHEADVDKSGVLSLIEMLQILRWSGFFPRLHIVVQAVLEVIPEIAEMSQASSPQAVLEKDLIKPAQFHILAPLLEERAECENVQRRVEISENMDLDEETQKLWGSSLVDLHDVFLRRAKQDLLPYTSLHHLAFDCGLVQHRAPGFREKLRNIASGEVSPQMMEEGFDLHDPSAVERAHFDFRQVLRIMTQIRQIEVELIGDVFAATDADETNGLSVEECMDCLAACGIEPTTKQMQDLIPRLVEEFDEDGSGELDLEEYLEFAKFVADRIRKMQHVGNMDDAQRIGYGEEEYMRLWDAFVAADENMDSHLEEEELLVAVMHARPDAETSSGDLRAILKDQGINYWKQACTLHPNLILLSSTLVVPARYVYVIIVHMYVCMYVCM